MMVRKSRSASAAVAATTARQYSASTYSADPGGAESSFCPTNARAESPRPSAANRWAARKIVSPPVESVRVVFARSESGPTEFGRAAATGAVSARAESACAVSLVCPHARTGTNRITPKAKRIVITGGGWASGDGAPRRRLGSAHRQHESREDLFIGRHP